MKVQSDLFVTWPRKSVVYWECDLLPSLHILVHHGGVDLGLQWLFWSAYLSILKEHVR